MTFPSRSPGLAQDANAGGPETGSQRYTFAGYALRLSDGLIRWPQIVTPFVYGESSHSGAYRNCEKLIPFLPEHQREGVKIVKLYAECPQ